MPTYQITDSSVLLTNGEIYTLLNFPESGVLRIRSNVSGNFDETETLVVINYGTPEWDACDPGDSAVTIERAGIRATVDLDPLRLQVHDKEGELLFATTGGSLGSREDHGLAFRYDLVDGERIYGLGQGDNSSLNIRGKLREIWNQTDGHESCGSLGVPFLYSSRGYGLLMNSSWATRFFVGGNVPTPKTFRVKPRAPWADREPPAVSPDESLILTDHDELDLYLICGPRYEDVIGGYRLLTGAPPILPRWALGYIQSKFGYINQDELLYSAQQFVQQDIPCSAMMLDITIYEKLGDLRFDSSCWPDLRGTARVLDALGIKLIAGQHPYIDEESLNYQEFAAAGSLINWATPEKYNFILTERYTHAFDFSHPQGKQLWWDKISKLYDAGVRGYWTDMAELENHPEGSSPHYAGSREKMQNIYGLNWAKTLYDGQRSHSEERLFMVQRSLYAGIQRYGVCNWSGDVDSTFEVLDRHVVIGQQVCLSGQTWWCTDIGGCQDSGDYYDPELFIRWLQWGTFCPIMRVHGSRDNEPWNFSEYYQPIITSLIRLRYSLMPYIYTYARIASETGCSIMRAMALLYPEDVEAVENDRQFMFGDSLLVAPVTRKGQREREVYLPAGLWYELETGASLTGGQYHTVDAPLNKIPVFVRGGSIIPRTGAEVRTRDLPAETEIHVYPGQDCRFELYEDDGHTFGYEAGEFAVTTIEYREDSRTLEIGKRCGGYEQMGRSRRLRVFLHGLSVDAGMLLNGEVVAAEPDGENAVVLVLGEVGNDQETTISLPVGIAGEEQTTGPVPRKQILADLEPSPIGCSVTLRNLENSDIAGLEFAEPSGWILDREKLIRRTDTSVEIPLRFDPRAAHSANGSLMVTSPANLRIPLGNGWATWWKIAGPYRAGIDGFHQVFLPEEALRLAPETVEAGVEIQRYESLWYSGFVNLRKPFAVPLPTTGPTIGAEDIYELCHKTAYASCVVTASEAIDGYVQLMADDRLKVWINGDIVALADETYTRVTNFRVRLSKGRNEIFVKCSQQIPHIWKELSSRPWGFNLRILDRDRQVTELLTYSID
ncbi:TIM-barrel domain-containing protein [Kribbella sp. CA-245084]|uniref:glycoside hydrolase family 31 protein n=1 Tax=Kribbella sp. CA-245084 TaxID=3239940 RepID=UPI003D8BB7B5